MILVVGQNSVYQRTCRISRVELGSVNRFDSVVYSAAGKGANTARAMAALGLDPLLIGYVGGDSGKSFLRELRGDAIPNSCVPIQSETRGCTTILEEGGEGTVRVTELVEPAPAITQLERVHFRENYLSALEKASFLVIAGTAVAGESDDCYRQCIRLARKRGVPVLLDAYRRHGRWALEASPDIFKINRQELQELCREEFGEYCNDADAAGHIRRRFAVQWLILTAGAHGAAAYDGEQILAARPPQVAYKNTIGSGDAFCAGIVSSVLHQAADAETPEEMSEGARRNPLRSCSIERALAAGVAVGTANCLSVKPGHLSVDDVDEIAPQIRIEHPFDLPTNRRE